MRRERWLWAALWIWVWPPLVVLLVYLFWPLIDWKNIECVLRLTN